MDKLFIFMLRRYNLWIMIVVSLLLTCIVVLFNVDIRYSSYLPTVFFGVGMSCFALRITITTSFTEKMPQDDNSIKNLKFFNKSLEYFIIYSLLYGAISAILYPIFLHTSSLQKEWLKVLEYNWYRIISGSILILFLQYVLKSLLNITIVTTKIINSYIDETNSRYRQNKYNK